jgi:hypothetical protein
VSRLSGPRHACDCPECEDKVPDQIEILLQEIAILRGEVAHLHRMIEQTDESVRNLNVTLLERINALVMLMQKLEALLPVFLQ